MSDGIPISVQAAHNSRVYLGLTSVFLTLCLAAVGIRFYARVRPAWRRTWVCPSWEDWLLLVGFVSVLHCAASGP